MPQLFLEVEPQLDTREAENRLTIVEALVLSLERSGRFNPNDVEKPSAVLWTDHDTQWQLIIPQLRRLLPQLLTFGEYQPAQRAGPAIWLRSVVDRGLPEIELPQGETPIIYLPRVSRQELRAVQECPDSLKPLVELQYRGVCWTQKNGKDWTVEAFLVSEEGGLSLDVARDATTRRAMLGALAELATTSIDRLKGKRLEAEDFDKLFSDDPAKDLLLWLSDPEAVKSEWNGGRWAAFKSRSRRLFQEPICGSCSTLPPTATTSRCMRIAEREHGAGKLEDYRRAGLAGIQGRDAWGKNGVCLSLMRNLPATLYSGHIFDMNTRVVWPKMDSDLPALWAFLSSPEYALEVRKLDRRLKLTTGTLLQVPFDHSRWERIAREQYPKGLPSPGSDDSSQWIFHGHPARANSPLHVAFSRLTGFRWPPESDPDIELAEEMRQWTKKATALHQFEDDDGVVCVPSVRGERPASERLLRLLHAAYGDDWDDGILTQLLAGFGNASLDDWLCNQFFEEHGKLFQQRPFIWHIWDGRKRDGFHAVVNYHKLVEGDGKGRRLLESLTYSYLGDWIGRQQDGVKRDQGGAEDRLSAALELQKRLIAIPEGEPPFDLFIRWKPIKEQSIGWEPDINDGVRLNIRPFMARDLPGGKKGAGILRAKPNIHWKKDRGKEPMREPAQYPWFWKNRKFTGERVNDVHFTLAEKRAACDRAGEKT